MTGRDDNLDFRHSGGIVAMQGGRHMRTSTAVLRRPIYLAFVLLFLLIVGFVASDARRDDGVDVTSTGQSVANGNWENFSEIPREPVAFPSLTWTGQEVIVFGGVDLRGGTGQGATVEAAKYDPQRGEWQRLESAPPELAVVQPRAVWTGDELVVLGNRCVSLSDSDEEVECEAGVAGGSYNPRENSWRVLALPEALEGDSEAFVESLGWTGSSAAFRVREDIWSFDPDSDQWQKLPEPPLPAEVVCVADGRVAVVDIPVTARQEQASKASVEAAVLGDARDSWRTTRAESVEGESAPSHATRYCGGPQVFVLAAEGGGLAQRFDISANEWTAIASPPASVGVNGTSLWTGEELLIWNGRDVLAYSSTEDVWREPPRVDPPSDSVWVGDRAVLYYLGDGRPEGVRYETYVP